MPPPAKKQHPSPANYRDIKTPTPVGAMHPSPAAQSIAAARPHDTIWRSSHERHRPADPDAAPGKETAPVPSPDGEGIKGRGDRAEFRPIYFARSPHGSRIRSFPVMSAAGRLNTPGPEQSAHRAVREGALKGQVPGQGVSFHSFVFPDFLEHLVLSLTEFVSAIVTREASPGRSRLPPPSKKQHPSPPRTGRGSRGGATAHTFKTESSPDPTDYHDHKPPHP